MTMFFNVESVRNFLIDNGYVFTLRKKRFRIGNDIAVHGSYFKQNRIGKILIETVIRRPIQRPAILTSYFGASGLKSSPEEWFKLATKLSGQNLYLYKVTLIGGE